MFQSAVILLKESRKIAIMGFYERQYQRVESLKLSFKLNEIDQFS